MMERGDDREGKFGQEKQEERSESRSVEDREAWRL